MAETEDDNNVATLYITEQGTTVRKEHNRLVIESDERRIAEIHDFKVNRVIIFGNVQLTTQVMGFLMDRGIDTTFLSRHGKLKGRLTPLESKNSVLRSRQYQRTHDAGFATGMARAFVEGKITNCSSILSRHQRNHKEAGLQSTIGQLASLKYRLAEFESRDSLRGIEGRAAAVYFEGLGGLFRRGWSFDKRRRRPPTDPINSLLSFGYTLLYNEAISALTAVGCDPYLGFLHNPGFGRCSLALDLMEEFRPLVADRLALNMLNLGMLSADDFNKTEEGGVILSDDARKIFFREYEKLVEAEFLSQGVQARTSLRRSLYDQAHAVRRSLMRGIQYRPFTGWR